MRIEVKMPRMGQSMEEGTLLAWFKSVGDTVKKGDVLIEIESDKATVEIEAFATGKLVGILVQEGQAVPVGAILGYIEDGKGQETTPMLDAKMPESINVKRILASPIARRLAKENDFDLSSQIGSGPNGLIIKRDIDDWLQSHTTPSTRIDISPVARRLAIEHNLNLSLIEGSGPRGRIIKRDIESKLDQQPTLTPKSIITHDIPTDDSIQPMSKIRRATANLMTHSKTTIPHFYVSIDINMGEALALRAQLKQRGHNISVNNLILKAVAITLTDYPNLNATYTPNGIQLHDHINLALAVALMENDKPTGLITPVIAVCETLPLVRLSQKADAIISRARINKLKAHDLSEGTFTVSNLGMFGVRQFEAIVNPPQVGILAVGGIRRIPMFDEQDNVVPMSLLTATLSADHRVTDGAEVASFMRDLRHVLEDGFPLLIEK